MLAMPANSTTLIGVRLWSRTPLSSEGPTTLCVRWKELLKVSQEFCGGWALSLILAFARLALDLSVLYGSHKEQTVEVLAISNQTWLSFAYPPSQEH